MRNHHVTPGTITLLLCLVFTKCTVPGEHYVSDFFRTGNRIHAHAIIDEGVLYFGSNDSLFYAVDLSSGQENWSYKAGAAVKGTAAIKGSTVYFSAGRHFYALDKNTGKEIWVQKTGSQEPYDSLDPWDYHHGPPVFHDKEVYFGSGNGVLYSFNAENGDLVYAWPTVDSAAVRCAPAAKGNMLYFGDWNGRIYAFDLVARDTQWTCRTYQTQLYPTFGQLNTRFQLHDSLLVFGARNPELQVVNIKTGKPVWSYEEKNGGWISGDPLVSGDTLFIGGSDCHRFYAFNVRTGELYWSQKVHFNNFSSPIILGDRILFTTGDAYAYMGMNYGRGYLHALDKKDGSIVNLSLVGGNAFTDLLYHGGKIYLGSDDGHIHAVDLHGFLSDTATLSSRGYQSLDSIKISPNPFVDSTTITMQVNYKTHVVASVYDLDRNKVRVLQDGLLTGGKHSVIWDGKDSLGNKVPAWYYIFEAGSGEFFQRAFVLRNE